MINSVLTGDTGSAILVILGLIAMSLSFSVAVRYWGLTVPVGPAAFTAMGIGSIAIGVFYLFVWFTPGPLLSVTVPLSRGLWAFVLVSTIIMSGTVLWAEDNGPRKPED